jgi:tRNA dimethylallyltransferase
MVTLPPLLVICGPTGVGKTQVAVHLAARLAIEVVSADSRQVYRGMDVATGKPTPAQRAAVPHHLLDVIEPSERYHAARFRREAMVCIDAIRGRGRLPVVVGGTGLYIRALLRGLDPAPPADPALRSRLEAMAVNSGVPALHARLATLDREAAARLHPNDRVRIIRAIEKHELGAGGPEPGGSWTSAVPPWRVLLVGLSQERGALNRRLAERAHGMLSGGMMVEVGRLLEAGYEETAPGMAGIGYRQFLDVLRGRLTEAQALALMVRDTRRYAKRQMTWFTREPGIRWLDVDETGGPEGAAERIAKDIAREGWTE